MATITITINTDNEAFDDGLLEHEVARICCDLASRFRDSHIRGGYMPESIKDINGNTVGKVEIEE